MVADDGLLPLGRHSPHVIRAVLVGVRHLSPDEKAQSVGPEQIAWVFDLLVLAGAVETHLLREFYVSAQVLVRGGSQDAFGEVALVEDEPLVVGAPVE